MLFRWALLFSVALAATAGARTAIAQLPAAEELKTLKAPEGTELSLFAAEPLVTNPSAIDVDTHGRVWVAEIQWYRDKARQPPADRIKVLEDTDGDGIADKAVVFAEGLFCPMSICVAGRRVYVATSPDLWVYEDKDGDLKADGPPTKLLTGFGGINHDHGAHSLVLGPDHKWWMSHGDGGFNVDGRDGSHIKSRYGAMIRGEMNGTRLEKIAENFRNPYEIAVSSFGESYCSDNDNDGNFSVRICWILEGGDYGWFGRPPFRKDELARRLPASVPYREAWHFRGYQPGYIPGTLVTGFGSPCGMCFYEGDAFGPKYKNAVLHADAGPREVRLYRHENAGYGMQATSETLITTQGDNYFRPVDVCAAPDGSLLIADWYDGGVGGHAYNDPNRGRIFRLSPAGKRPPRREKPGPYANIADAIEALESPNLATQFLARERLLAQGAESAAALEKIAAEAESHIKARALWLLDRLGGEARQSVVRRLSDSDPALRALAVRILRRHGKEFASQLIPLVDDSSGEVAREALLACAALDDESSLAAIARSAARYDGRDRYHLETLNIAAGARKAALVAKLDASMWRLDNLALLQALDPAAAAEIVAAKLATPDGELETTRRWIEAARGIPSPAMGRSILKLASDRKGAQELRAAALSCIAANLGGDWKALRDEPQLADALRGMLIEPPLQEAVLSLIEEQRLADLADAVCLVALVPDPHAGCRPQAIAIASRLSGPEFSAPLRALLNDPQPTIRDAARLALVERHDLPALRTLFLTSPAAEQKDAAERLLRSSSGAVTLLRLIDENHLTQDLKGDVVEKAAAHPDANVRVLFEKFIPSEKRPKRLGSEIKAEDILALAGDPRRGERIFFQSGAAQCKNCHAIRGKGTPLGPDLSQIGRKYERRALLETILEPSKAIAPEFAAYLLETSSGQVFAGFLTEKSDREVVLRDIKNQTVRVPLGDVAALESQSKSLMPELVLRDVTAQDAADLLAYLSSLTEAPRKP